MKILKPIPCNIITGFLGVGKTTTILNLLKLKPNNEKWAVLVNEFGEIGLDGALIDAEQEQNSGVFIREVPGGCMCCASGLPMQIALNMLMIKAKPDRLLIEPTGLGHPKEVIQVLSSEHYKNVIQLENTITLVDARHFNSQKHLSNETFQQQLEVADLLVINKSDLCSKKDIDTFKSYISTHSELKLKPYLLTKEGNVGLGYLNTQQTLAKAKTIKEDSCVHSSSISPIEKPSLPDCGFLVKSHRDGNFTSVGWRIKADKIFDIDAVYDWIKTLDASRIKAVLNSKSGFISLNISSDHFNSSDPIHKKDKLDHNKKQYDESRLEIIFEEKELNDDLINAWTEYFLQL